MINNERKRMIWMTIAFACTVISLLSYSMIYRDRYEIKWTYFGGADSFLKTDGTIIRTDISYGMDTSEKQGPFYSPGITYIYTVNNTPYTSERISFPEIRFDNRETAKNYMTGFAAGSKVTVYYDPADPAISLLDPARKQSFLFRFLGALLLPGFILSAFLRRSYGPAPEHSGTAPETKPDNPAH